MRRSPSPRSLLGLARGPAGQLEEDVVEGRGAESRCRRSRCPASSSRRTASAIAPRRSRDRDRAPCRRGRRGAPSAIRASDVDRRRRHRRRASSADLEPVAADPLLQLGGACPRRSWRRGRSPRSGRRGGRPRRGTGWSAAPSCRRRRAPRSTPRGRSGCAGRGPWSARRGRGPAAARPAPRRGRAGAACRPSTSAPGGRPRRRGRSPPAAARARSAASRARQVVEAADHLQVLGAGQVLVDGRVLAGKADLGAQRGGWRVTSMPATRALPPSGAQQRRQDPDGGRLAGAVRAEQAEHAARPRRRRRRRTTPPPSRIASEAPRPRSPAHWPLSPVSRRGQGLRFRSQTMRSPCSVSSGSTAVIVRECGAIRPASPPVATTGASGASSSARTWSTIPSTWPAKP